MRVRLIMNRVFSLITLALATIVGCHSGTPGVGSSSTPPPTVDDSAREPNDALDREKREYSAPSMRALDKRPIVGPPPRIVILQPKNQALVARGPVMLKLQVSRWKLAPAPGNHVHIKIDDSKEFAIRDVSKPIELDERYEKETGQPLSEGSHVLRVFLSRPNHEGVKVPSAFDSIVFHYRSKTKGWSFDGTQPMLTYSRPEGCASDRTDSLILSSPISTGCPERAIASNTSSMACTRARCSRGARIRSEICRRASTRFG
jgi:hypothetical protein